MERRRGGGGGEKQLRPQLCRSVTQMTTVSSYRYEIMSAIKNVFGLCEKQEITSQVNKSQLGKLLYLTCSNS